MGKGGRDGREGEGKVAPPLSKIPESAPAPYSEKGYLTPLGQTMVYTQHKLQSYHPITHLRCVQTLMTTKEHNPWKKSPFLYSTESTTRLWILWMLPKDA